MKKTTDKPDFQERSLPRALEGLPRFAFKSSRSAGSREQSGRDDIAFNIRTSRDLIDAMKEGFADPDAAPPKPVNK